MTATKALPVLPRPPRSLVRNAKPKDVGQEMKPPVNPPSKPDPKDDDDYDSDKGDDLPPFASSIPVAVGETGDTALGSPMTSQIPDIASGSSTAAPQDTIEETVRPQPTEEALATPPSSTEPPVIPSSAEELRPTTDLSDAAEPPSRSPSPNEWELGMQAVFNGRDPEGYVTGVLPSASPIAPAVEEGDVLMEEDLAQTMLPAPDNIMMEGEPTPAAETRMQGREPGVNATAITQVNRPAEGNPPAETQPSWTMTEPAVKDWGS
ncbi:hypothetical protein HGRIS_001461 [Hohenbuehelia grisea]|uniref:Uncharacterized protein n=1 Tax=Hohenbuehelia grisea TaxID=104357 RepID=A0ABR3JPE3_9AGAR